MAVDEAVEGFRTGALDGGPYTFVAVDALVLEVRENGGVVAVHTLIGIKALALRSDSFRINRDATQSNTSSNPARHRSRAPL
jgi:hypothetical protein